MKNYSIGEHFFKGDQSFTRNLVCFFVSNYQRKCQKPIFYGNPQMKTRLSGKSKLLLENGKNVRA